MQRTEGIQTSADDNVLVKGVAGEAGGLGYFGFSFYEQNQDTLNAVKVDGGKGCIDPTADDDPERRATRRCRGRCYMYPSDKALKKPEVKAFMQFVMDNYDTIAEAAKIVPMNAEQATEAKSEIGS